MTPEELEAAIRTQSAEKLAEMLSPLTEPERKKLAKVATAVRRQAKEEISAVYRSLRIYSSENASLRSASGFEHRADLAILALGAWTEAKKVPSYLSGWEASEYGPSIYQVLKARRPEWLERWVTKELEGRSAMDWGLLRQFIREGLCSRPTTDAYIVKMVRSHAGFHHRRGASLAEVLKADPDLLEWEVWRIFEVDPGNETLLSEGEVNPHPTAPLWQGWAGALNQLSREGRLDRARLLRAALEALNRALQPKNTGWFWKFHECLAPTAEERAGLQAHYLKLLASPVPPVVGFALDGLLEVGKARKLDEAALIEAIGPVFQLRPKQQPLTALRLLKQAAKQPAVKSRAALAATAALQHEKTEVQEKALDLLEELLDPGSTAGLQARLEALAPSLQGRARALLHKLEGSPSAPATEPAEALPTLDTIHAEAAAVPQPWRTLIEIDALLQGELRPVRLVHKAIPRLDPAGRTTPIGDLDELIEGLSAAVEDLRDAEEFERLLDGVSRLFLPRPADFEARMAPLVHRIRKLTESWGQSHVGLLNFGLRFGLFSLIRCWCDGTPPFETDPEKIGGPLWFLAHRLHELTLRIRKRRPAPLLACPTHRRGWLEPVEVVSRLRWWHEHHVQADKHDLIQALLRLAPDGRASALQAAHDLPGESGAALRYALGGDREGQLDVAVDLAASRAREPRGEIPELASCEAATGPDGATPGSYQWNVRKVTRGWEEGMGLHLEDFPALARYEAIGSQPTMLLHRMKRETFVNDSLEHRWAATVWPHHLDPVFAQGAKSIDRRLDDTASPYTGNPAFLEPLLDPDTPFTEMAQLLLAVSLVSRDADVSGLAVDALIQMIGDGRCAGQELGGLLGRLLADGLAKPNRLAKSLETVARGSLLHMHVCGEMLQTAIVLQSSWPKELHHLLAVLQEWLAALQQPIRQELRLKLETLQRSGKTESLARKLLARDGLAGPATWQAVLSAAATGRIERAQRWASWCRKS